MGKALSLDLRQRVVGAYRRGEGTQVEVAKRFGVSVPTIRRWLRREEGGKLEFDDSYHHGPQPLIETVKLAQLEELLGVHPDATNAELAELLGAQTGLHVSASTISRAVGLLEWSRKKSASSPASATPRISAIFVQSGPSGRRTS